MLNNYSKILPKNSNRLLFFGLGASIFFVFCFAVYDVYFFDFETQSNDFPRLYSTLSTTDQDGLKIPDIKSNHQKYSFEKMPKYIKNDISLNSKPAMSKFAIESTLSRDANTEDDRFNYLDGNDKYEQDLIIEEHIIGMRENGVPEEDIENMIETMPNPYSTQKQYNDNGQNPLYDIPPEELEYEIWRSLTQEGVPPEDIEAMSSQLIEEQKNWINKDQRMFSDK